MIKRLLSILKNSLMAKGEVVKNKQVTGSPEFSKLIKQLEKRIVGLEERVEDAERLIATMEERILPQVNLVQAKLQQLEYDTMSGVRLASTGL